MFSTQLWRTAEKVLAPHMAAEGRKFIVYTNEANRARKHILRYCRAAMGRVDGYDGDVLDITGDSSIAWKSMVVDMFCRSAASDGVVNLLGISATAAARAQKKSNRGEPGMFCG